MNRQRPKRTHFITALVISLMLSGCTKNSLSPCRSFSYVSKEIECKTGKTVAWCTEGYVVAEINCILNTPLTVDDAVRVALLNNRELQAMYEEIGIAQAELVQAGLLRNPIFDFSYRWALNEEPGYKLEMGIAQDFLDIFLIPLKKKRAIANLEQVKLSIIEAVLDVAIQTQIEFYRMQAAQAMLDQYQLLEEIAERACEFNERLLDAGNIYQLDLTRTQIAMEMAKLQMEEADVSVIESKERLNVLMGLWGQHCQWQITTTPLTLDCEASQLLSIEESAVTSNIHLKKKCFELRQVAAENGIEVTETVMPELGVGAISEREVDGQWNLGPGFALGIPIFDFGFAKSAAGKAKLRQIQKEMVAYAIDLRAGARRLRHELHNAHAQGTIALDGVGPLMQKENTETHLFYNAMQVGTLDLLDSKRRAVEAEILAIEKVRDYRIVKAKIDYLLKGYLYEKR